MLSGYDRLGKVRPIITYLSTKFAKLYDPHKEVAVDEAMIKFQGRSSLKPVKRGIKVWVLADSRNGYLSKFEVYTGEGATAEKGLDMRVVKTLTSELKGMNHHVFFESSLTISSLSFLWQFLHQPWPACRFGGRWIPGHKCGIVNKMHVTWQFSKSVARNAVGNWCVMKQWVSLPVVVEKRHMNNPHENWEAQECLHVACCYLCPCGMLVISHYLSRISITFLHNVFHQIIAKEELEDLQWWLGDRECWANWRGEWLDVNTLEPGSCPWGG